MYKVFIVSKARESLEFIGKARGAIEEAINIHNAGGYNGFSVEILKPNGKRLDINRAKNIASRIFN